MYLFWPFCLLHFLSFSPSSLSLFELEGLRICVLRLRWQSHLWAPSFRAAAYVFFSSAFYWVNNRPTLCGDRVVRLFYLAGVAARPLTFPDWPSAVWKDRVFVLAITET